MASKKTRAGDVDRSAAPVDVPQQRIVPEPSRPELRSLDDLGPISSDQRVRFADALVQLRGALQARFAGEAQAEHVRQQAAEGVRGAGGSLPHRERIQAAFGDHDISHVRAHTDGAAQHAAKAIGAQAYATGDRVAFGGQPDLRTAAHEAAHVVQQRGGVNLSQGVGRSGDRYEREADAVADAVVGGRSAESLLAGYTSSAGGGGPVQRQAVGVIQMNRSWVELSTQEQADWEILGWNATRWDNDQRPPSASTAWDDLTPAQQAAADRLGWDRATWDDTPAESSAERPEERGQEEPEDPRYSDRDPACGQGDAGTGWWDLPPHEREAWETLGFDEACWEADARPDTAYRSWDDLTPAEQDAADVLGYDQASWDADTPETMPECGIEDTAAESAFVRAFNREFAPIIPSLHSHQERSDAEEAGPRVTEAYVRHLFTAQQMRLISQYCQDHIIPDRLFNGIPCGGATAQERIIISTHVLSHGTWRRPTPQPESGSDESASSEQPPAATDEQASGEDAGGEQEPLNARFCGHWTQLVYAYAGVRSPAGGGGTVHTHDHAGNIVLSDSQGSNEGGFANFDNIQGQPPLLAEGTEEQQAARSRRLRFLSASELSPGDWLELAADGHHGTGPPNQRQPRTHSVILLRVVNPGSPIFTIEHTSQSTNPTNRRTRRRQQGRRSIASGEEIHEQPGQGKTVIYARRRVNEEAGSAEEPADVVPELGGRDGAGSANERYLVGWQMRRNLGLGRSDPIDQAHLCRWLVDRVVEQNTALINGLDPERVSPQQFGVLRRTNTAGDRGMTALEQVIRLNERLRQFHDHAERLEGSVRQQTETLERAPDEQDVWVSQNDGISMPQAVGSPRDRGTSGRVERLENIPWGSYSPPPQASDGD